MIILVVLQAAFSATATVAAFGAYRRAEETRILRVRPEAARLPVRPRNVDFREIEGLPAPVQQNRSLRFLRNLRDFTPARIEIPAPAHAS